MAEEATAAESSAETEVTATIKTAFLVLVLDDDTINIQTQPDVLNFPIQREANGKDLRRAALEIAADLAAQSAAQYVLAGIKQAEQ